jgi:hypothetical protein
MNLQAFYGSLALKKAWLAYVSSLVLVFGALCPIDAQVEET